MRSIACDVQLFRNLLEAPEMTNAWRDHASFDTSRLSIDQKKVLTAVEGLQFKVPGTREHHENCDSKWSEVSNFWTEFVAQFERPIFVFSAEHRAQLRNRIRSHKGFLKQKPTIRDSVYFECEHPVGDDQTVFVGMVKVSESNRGECLELLASSERSFAFSSLPLSREDLPGLLRSIASSCLAGTQRIYLNYVNVISEVCAEDAIVVRIGGDGGDEYFAFQFFGAHGSLKEIIDKKGQRFCEVEYSPH